MRSYSDGWTVTEPHLARTAFASLRTEMPSTRTSPSLGAVAIAVIASIAEGALGLLVLVFTGPPREALHILYGFAVVLAMPLAASLVRDRAPRGQSVALGFAALFTAGLVIRGIITA